MFLFADCETTGLLPNVHVPLTFAFILTDEKLNPIDKIQLAMKHDLYPVVLEALKTNNINLVDHHAAAQSQMSCERDFGEWLLPHVKDMLQQHPITGQWAVPKGMKIIPAGHNIPFDIGFIKAFLMKDPFWSNFMDYHFLDTNVIGLGHKIMGLIPPGVGLSLVSLAKFHGIQFIGEAHTAMADAQATLDLAKVLLKLV